MNKSVNAGFRHTKIRHAMGYRMEDVEALLFFALVAISDSDGNLQAMMFADCLMAFEAGIGTLHVLAEGHRQTAFCFVLDKYDDDSGAYHLHLVSVIKSARGKGAGRALIDAVMKDIGAEPVTLESRSEAVGFFENAGFKRSDMLLDHGLVAMHTNTTGKQNSFKKPVYNDYTRKVYMKRFEERASAFGFKLR